MTDRARWERLRAPRVPADRLRVHVLNAAFYVPVPILGAGFRVSLPVAVATGFAFSAAAESFQLYSIDRIPDMNDLLLNCAGTLLGAAVVRRSRRAGGARS
jgi:glycopeptide antibiotics resistance protein